MNRTFCKSAFPVSITVYRQQQLSNCNVTAVGLFGDFGAKSVLRDSPDGGSLNTMGA